MVQLASTFIKFPVTALENALATTSFQEFTDCAISQVVGAVDGTHIEILAPSSQSRLDYFSRKQKYTIKSQAVVGSNLMFLNASTGFAKQCARCQNVTCKQIISEANELLTRPEKTVEQMSVC